MPGDVVNLRRWRKSARRRDDKARADANAALHGLAKPVTDLARARAEREAKAHEGHRLDDEGTS